MGFSERSESLSPFVNQHCPLNLQIQSSDSPISHYIPLHPIFHVGWLSHIANQGPIHTHKHTHAYVYIYTCIYIYIFLCMYVCMYVCM